MTRTLAVDSQRVALDLHALLRETDPAGWRDELEASARARLAAIQDQLGDLVAPGDATFRGEPSNPSDSHPCVRTLQSRMAELAELIGELAPSTQWPTDARRKAWMELHVALRPAYDRLAATLDDWSLAVPRMGRTPVDAPRLATPERAAASGDDAVEPARPTNYARNVFHALMAVGVILLVEQVLVTRGAMIGVALAGCVWAWSMELGRRVSPRVNELLMQAFRPVAHPHEATSINSATWYTTSLLVLALLFDRAAGVTALAVLGFGDPAAALVGKRFGRTRLVNGRSLEGSLAFVVVGTVAALAVLVTWYAALTPGATLAVAVAAAVFGAVAELLARRIDDNIAIPVAAAIGASIALGALS